MKVNPHHFLGGAAPRIKGWQNQLAVVDWLYRFGYSSAAVLQDVLSKQSSGWAATAERRGLLQSVRTVSRVPPRLYLLAADGLELAEQHADELLPYPEIDPARVNQSMLRHNLLVQSLTAKELLAKRIVSFTSERQLSSDLPRGVKRPDVIWELSSGTRVAVEVELTAKWGRHLDDFVAALVRGLQGDSRKESAFDRVAVITTSPAIAERYTAALAGGAPLRTWVKDQRGHWRVERQESVPPEIGRRVAMKVLPS